MWSNIHNLMSQIEIQLSHIMILPEMAGLLDHTDLIRKCIFVMSFTLLFSLYAPIPLSCGLRGGPACTIALHIVTSLNSISSPKNVQNIEYLYTHTHHVYTCTCNTCNT